MHNLYKYIVMSMTAGFFVSLTSSRQQRSFLILNMCYCECVFGITHIHCSNDKESLQSIYSQNVFIIIYLENCFIKITPQSSELTAEFHVLFILTVRIFNVHEHIHSEVISEVHGKVFPIVRTKCK